MPEKVLSAHILPRKDFLMSTHETEQNWQHVRVVRPGQFDANTPQTPGMQRVAAVSRELAGAQGIWAGVTVVAPHVARAKHHHGELETVST